MDKLKAKVVKEDDKHFISIGIDSADVRIPMSEDNPDDVKRAFNKLIVRLRSGEFEISFDETGDDLFVQVAKEYVAQLNRDIHDVYIEMVQGSLDRD